MEFKIVRKGYDKQEVDAYIERLTKDYESRLAKQKDRIFFLKDKLENKSTSDEPLIEIDNLVKQAKSKGDDRNLYYLEAKRLMLIYGKMEKLLSSDNLSPNAKDELLSFIKNCKQSLEDSLSRKKPSPTQDDTIKKLLAKMMGLNVHKNIARGGNSDLPYPDDIDAKSMKKVDKDKKDTTKSKKDESKKQTKKEKGDFSNFLSKSSNVGSNFESIMFKNNSKTSKTPAKLDYSPNETGFDLKAAVNPTEDLDEIMKAFDFYNDKKSKK